MKRTDTAPAAKVSVMHLNPLFKGAPIASPHTRDMVIVFWAIVAYMADVTFAQMDDKGNLVPVAPDLISPEAGLHHIQHGGARPETLRALLAGLAAEALRRERAADDADAERWRKAHPEAPTA